MAYQSGANLNLYATQMRVLQQVAGQRQQVNGRPQRVKTEGTFDVIEAQTLSPLKSYSPMKSEFGLGKSPAKDNDSSKWHQSTTTRVRQSTKGNRFSFTPSEDALLQTLLLTEESCTGEQLPNESLTGFCQQIAS
jgi:hypothetical protein